MVRDIGEQVVSRTVEGLSAIVDKERWCCSFLSVPISLPELLTFLLRDPALKHI